MKRTPVLRVAYSDSGNISTTTTQRTTPQTVQARDSVPGSVSSRSWQAANQTRRRLGRRKAIVMLVMKVSRLSGQEIADLFGTTRGSVYVRLHRLRSGRYTA